MKKSASFKIRAVGSASALALTVGLATTAVAQNMAPAPVDAVPMPMAPAAPGNGTECALDAMAMPSTVTCAPGTDANGFQDPALNAAELTVEVGAQVQGEIALGTDIVAAVDGDIIVAGGQSALDLGTGASMVNNGYLSATPFFDGIISVGNGSTVTNTGIITTATGNVTAGIFSDGTTT